jgi:arginine deiminase
MKNHTPCTVNVSSETGRLRAVLLHRPGVEIERTAGFRLLLFGGAARERHHKQTQNQAEDQGENQADNQVDDQGEN